MPPYNAHAAANQVAAVNPGLVVGTDGVVHGVTPAGGGPPPPMLFGQIPAGKNPKTPFDYAEDAQDVIDITTLVVGCEMLPTYGAKDYVDGNGSKARALITQAIATISYMLAVAGFGRSIAYLKLIGSLKEIRDSADPAISGVWFNFVGYIFEHLFTQVIPADSPITRQAVMAYNPPQLWKYATEPGVHSCKSAFTR